MTEDERAITALIDTWMEASKRGDLEKIMSLMADDVVFMVPGREPFGKTEFAQMSHGMKDVRVEGEAEIVELKVLGDWAWLRNRLRIAVTPPKAPTARRSGYTLTILRKNETGRWVLLRDANLLAPEP
jgi:uncharacterized protein (TIGR02246 family)